MKTISIRQPWAWAICNLPSPFKKNCINQLWCTDKRGLVLICANNEFDQEGYILLKDILKEMGYKGKVPREEEFVRNSILGVGRIIDCINGDFNSPWAVNPEHHTVYKIILEDIYLLKSPIRCEKKSYSGFFTFSLLA